MKIKDLEITITKGDISETDAEAIVNQADTGLLMNEEAARAIKEKGGVKIEDAARAFAPAEAAQAVLTEAGGLKAHYVIHVVTHQAGKKTDEVIVRRACFNALMCAHDKGVASLAFPPLGCGAAGFSESAASKIMAQEVFRYTRDSKEPSLKRIEFIISEETAYRIFKKNVEGYLTYMVHKLSAGPYLTVDGIIEYEGGVVLIERSNPPFGWAIPGGFVDYGESVEDAVARETKEETGLTFKDFTLFKVCSAPGRDPRFHTVAVVFAGKGEGILRAADDAASAGVFTRDTLPEVMAFDHRQIIEEYFKKSSK